MKFNFSHFTPQARPTSFPGGENPRNRVEARLFFVRKWKSKILGFKNVMERGITFVMRYIASKIFGKIILKPLQFGKDSSSSRMTEQVQIL